MTPALPPHHPPQSPHLARVVRINPRGAARADITSRCRAGIDSHSSHLTKGARPRQGSGWCGVGAFKVDNRVSSVIRRRLFRQIAAVWIQVKAGLFKDDCRWYILLIPPHPAPQPHSPTPAFTPCPVPTHAPLERVSRHQ